MKLTTADKVLERMNLSNTIGSASTPSIDSALEASTALIESIIRTPVKASSRKDFFDYTTSRYSSFSPFVLWLSQGFLVGKPKIYFSDDGYRVDDITQATLLTENEYVIDSKLGKITILKEPLKGYATVLVRYTAGFTEGSNSIPSWLEEAAISAAVYMNHTQSISHGKKDAEKMTKPLSGIIYSLVNEHIITPYDGFYPSSTLVY